MNSMPPEEYLRRWKEMLAAADANDDALFWRLYSDWCDNVEVVSRERLALRKMARRLVKRGA